MLLTGALQWPRHPGERRGLRLRALRHLPVRQVRVRRQDVHGQRHRQGVLRLQRLQTLPLRVRACAGVRRIDVQRRVQAVPALRRRPIRLELLERHDQAHGVHLQQVPRRPRPGVLAAPVQDECDVLGPETLRRGVRRLLAVQRRRARRGRGVLLGPRVFRPHGRPLPRVPRRMSRGPLHHGRVRHRAGAGRPQLCELPHVVPGRLLPDRQVRRDQRIRHDALRAVRQLPAGSVSGAFSSDHLCLICSVF